MEERFFLPFDFLTVSSAFSATCSAPSNITPTYIDYVEKMPSDYYNAMQYGYQFNLANNIFTDFKITDKNIAPEDDACPERL